MMGRQPRQRPISCHLCRVRKLRCSRQFPCSNCTSRGVVCQHEGPSTSSLSQQLPPPQQQQLPQIPKSLPKDISAFDLLSRLERLENLVAAQSKDSNSQLDPPIPPQQHQPPPPPPPPPQTQQSQYQQPPASQPHKPVTYPVQTPSQPAVTTPTSSRSVPPKIQRLTADALKLERTCADGTLTDSLLADPIIFRTCPIRLVTGQPSYVIQNGGSPAGNGLIDAIKCVWIPRRDEMRIVIQKYISDVSFFHHIIHVPTLQRYIEEIFTSLEQNAPVDVGGIILVLSICASATYCWEPRDDVRCVFSNSAEANSQSIFWIKQALDVADYAQRTAHASLECIQGLVILFYVFCNHESASKRARNVIMSAISMATELRLHRLDDPSVQNPVLAGELTKEIARRVWWYLVAMDWMLAQFNHPQEGFYAIHSTQMVVNKPRNLHDGDMIDGVDFIERPLTEPTCVSYFLQRIRLAELCYENLNDNASSAGMGEQTAYQQVIETDAKINQFLRDIPDFLSLDRCPPNMVTTDSVGTTMISAQRYTLNLLLHRQLCKIHLPYLAPGTVDSAFAYSRDACLKSAKTVIELDHQLQRQYLPFATSRLRVTMVLRSVFLASVVLVLNQCLKPESVDNGDSDDEVAGAWSILQEAQGQSPTTTKLLELSVKILRKYNIKDKALDGLQQNFDRAPTSNDSLPMTPESAQQDHRINVLPQSYVPPPTDTALVEQQWQMLEGRMDLNSVEWDKLFWGLDAPFM